MYVLLGDSNLGILKLGNFGNLGIWGIWEFGNLRLLGTWELVKLEFWNFGILRIL